MARLASGRVTADFDFRYLRFEGQRMAARPWNAWPRRQSESGGCPQDDSR
jgi:hypothetical protein